MREKEWEETKGRRLGERKRKKKKKRGWPYRRLLPPADTQALWEFTRDLQRREDWNSALPEIIRVLCQEEVISLQSSAQAEALQPDSCI